MPVVGTQQIWDIGSGVTVLILATWPRDEHGEDVRIAPVTDASDDLKVMADRDVLIAGPSGASTLIAHAWLAQSLSSEVLRTLVGTCEASDFAAVRNAELVGMVAGAERRDTPRRGQAIEDANDPRIEGMRALIQRIDLALQVALQSQPTLAWQDLIKFRPGAMYKPLAQVVGPLQSDSFVYETLYTAASEQQSAPVRAEDADAFSRAA